MRRNWTPEDLESVWSLHSPEMALLRNKSGATRLGFAGLLKFFQEEGRFPEDPSEVPFPGIQHVASQLQLVESWWQDYKWGGRAIKYHRSEIREWCGFREFSLADHETLKGWLIQEVIPQEHRQDRLTEAMHQWCRGLRIEPPADEHGQRILNSALQGHEITFTQGVYGKLDRKALDRLDDLLKTQPSEDEPEWTPWQALKTDPGKAGVESVKATASRLREAKAVGLPPGLFKDMPPKLIERYAKRAAVEEPHELRRHGGPLRTTLMATDLHRRGEELTDHLVDLLIETI